MTRQSNMEDEGVKQEDARKYGTSPGPRQKRAQLLTHGAVYTQQDILARHHNMVEELYEFNTPWYDNCLIVEVHDYRSAGVKPKDDTNSTGEAGTSAFSIHNYNNFITPSPFAPFPVNKPDAKPGQPNAQSKDDETKEDKENMPAPGQNGALSKQPGIGRSGQWCCFRLRSRNWPTCSFWPPRPSLTWPPSKECRPRAGLGACHRLQ